MDQQVEDPAQEIKRLRRCLNDLISITARPAASTGSESKQIANDLLDALGLAFVLIRFNDSEESSGTEIVKTGDAGFKSLTPQIGTAIDKVLGNAPLRWPSSARVTINGSDFSLASARLGVDGEIGVLLAATPRSDFPQPTERLLLDVAANRAALSLQQERRLEEQKRPAIELEERVAHRTRELAAANEQLKIKESESRLIVDNIPGLIALMSPTGDIDMVNRQLLEYFGQTLEELRSWGTNDTVHPEDLPRVIEVFSRSLATGTPYEISQRYKRADGMYRWFQNRGFPLCEANGKIARWCVLLTDIDDQKRAEDALQGRSRDLKLIIDTIPAMLWSTHPDGSGDFYNQHYLDYTGFTLEEALGWGWKMTIHPDDLASAISNWNRVRASGQTGGGEHRLRRHDGIYRWFFYRASPLRDEDGNIVKWYGILADIEDRKRAEEDLRHKEEFLSKAQSLSQCGCFSWYVDTNQVTFSDEACRIHGFEVGAPITLEMIANNVHPDDRSVLAEKIGGARGSSDEQDYEIRLLLPDGSIKYVHSASEEIIEANGRRRYLGAVQDVTRRRLAEAALEKARSELAHVARITALSALTASIAHEVSQPLSGIVTNTGTCLRMLDANPPNIEGARETVKRALRDGNRASEVITRLRALYSKKEPSRESMDLNEAARDVTALTLSELYRNRVTLRVDLAEDLPPIVGDRIQLQQVILNLLRNAADAMSIIEDRPRDLLVRTERDMDHHVRLSVKDSGVGLTPQAAEKIFEAFYTTKTDGMGIGLSISRSIIEAHQGRIWAAPNSGPGATFSFAIPYSLDALDDGETRASRADSSEDAA